MRKLILAALLAVGLMAECVEVYMDGLKEVIIANEYIKEKRYFKGCEHMRRAVIYIKLSAIECDGVLKEQAEKALADGVKAVEYCDKLGF